MQPEPLFPLGQIVATPAALESVPNDDILMALGRHQAGDWGDMDDEDKQANNDALVSGARLFSAYHTLAGVKFWVITEADARASTTVLLPDDY
jgi:hypothetical protein